MRPRCCAAAPCSGAPRLVLCLHDCLSLFLSLPAMAPWQLEEFTREKVERARRLLAEPGEQQGSAFLQAREPECGEVNGRPGGTLAWRGKG